MLKYGCISALIDRKFAYAHVNFSIHICTYVCVCTSRVEYVQERYGRTYWHTGSKEAEHVDKWPLLFEHLSCRLLDVGGLMVEVLQSDLLASTDLVSIFNNDILITSPYPHKHERVFPLYYPIILFFLTEST